MTTLPSGETERKLNQIRDYILHMKVGSSEGIRAYTNVLPDKVASADVSLFKRLELATQR